MSSIFSEKFRNLSAPKPPRPVAPPLPPLPTGADAGLAVEFAPDDESQSVEASVSAPTPTSSVQAPTGVQEKVASALVPVSARWCGPESQSRRSTTENLSAGASAATVTATVTGTVPQVVSRVRKSVTVTSPAVTTFSAPPVRPAARVHTPAPEPVITLDPQHVEPYHPADFDDVQAYLAQDGTVWNVRDLATAGFLRANGLWYSPGEVKAGLHFALPPEAVSRPAAVTCLRPGRDGGTVRVHIAVLCDSRGRIFTKEQWGAAQAAWNPPAPQNPLAAITNRFFRKRRA